MLISSSLYLIVILSNEQNIPNTIFFLGIQKSAKQGGKKMKKRLPIILVASLMALGAGAASVSAVKLENQPIEAKATTADIGSFNIIRGTEGVDYTIEGNKIITNSSSDLLLESTVEVTKTGHLKFDDYKFPRFANGASCGISIIVNATVNNEGKITGDIVRPYINTNWDDGPCYLCQGWVVDDVYGTNNDVYSDHTNFGTNRDYEFWWTSAIGATTMAGWRSRSFFLSCDGSKVFIHVKNTECEITNPTVEENDDAIFNRAYRHQWGCVMLWQRTTCFNQNQIHEFTLHLPDSVNVADIDHLYLTKYALHGRTTDLAEVTINGGTPVQWDIQDDIHYWEGDWQKEPNPSGNFDLEINKADMDADRNFRFSIKTLGNEIAVSTYALIYEIDGVMYSADRLVCGNTYSENIHNYYESAQGWRGTQEWTMRPGYGCKIIGKAGQVVPTIDYPTFTADSNALSKTFAKATEFDFLSNINVIPNGMDYRHELWLDFGNGSFKVTKNGQDAFSYLFTQSDSCTWYVDLFMANPDNSGVYKVTISGTIVVTVTASDDAIAWAQSFNTTIAAACDASGNTDVAGTLSPAWENVRTSWNALSDDAKEALTTSQDEDVVAALAKYDYVINKYGTLNDFLGRKASGGSSANNSTLIKTNGIIVAAFVAFFITSISVIGIVMLKRRKRSVK